MSPLKLFAQAYDVNGVMYVNQAIAVSGSGASWASPIKELRDALTIAQSNAGVKQIWVAKGTYLPTSGTDRTVSFQMYNAYSIYGGFRGNETSIASRNVNANPTILSGDIGVPGDISDNSYRVVWIHDNTVPIVLDGFTITKGYSSTNAYLGGTNGYTIEGGFGAGIEIVGTTNLVTLNQLHITGNQTIDGGGGIDLFRAAPIIMNNSVFDSNVVQSTDGTIGSGGGLQVEFSSVITLNNCVFYNNQALGTQDTGGGAIMNYGGTINLINCTLFDNFTKSTGAGYVNTDGISNESDDASLVSNVVNTIIYSKGAVNVADHQTNYSLSTSYTNSLAIGSSFGGTNLNTDPLFVHPSNPAGADGVLGTADDGIQIACVSPARKAGSAALGTSTDITGTSRGGTPDMGAYQQTGIGVVPSVSIAITSGSPCANTAITFNAGPVNGGTLPHYQWQVNGNDAGTDNAAFNTGTLKPGDIISCKMTPDYSICVTVAQVTSNTITINSLPQITAANISTVNAGANFPVVQLNATGGVAPYAFVISGGNLPAGTSLSTGGIISGTTSTPGSYQFQVQVTDGGCSSTATQSFTADVNGLSSLVPSRGTLSPAFDPVNTNYTLQVANGVNSITFVPTAGNNGASISVNGSPVASGGTSGPIALNVGSNAVNIIIIAADGTTANTYHVNVTRLSSSDATLTDLKISSGTLSPGFAAATNAYTASVDNSVSSVTVVPTTTDANATITINGITVSNNIASGPIALNVGSNTITTVVTAPDGTTTDTYTLEVIRLPSTDASLSNLVVSSGALTPVFDPATTTYTQNVGNATATITVKPTANNTNATIKVNGTAILSGQTTAAIPLNVGSNTIITTVTAQDGTTAATYKVTITRAPSSDANLANLTISSGTLTPSFAGSTTNYIADVSNATTSVRVTPTTSDANATIVVNGTPVIPGTATTNIPLIVGANTITTVVTAQDGTTTNTYTLTITRAPSSDASLVNLTISSGSLTPVFASGTKVYTASVSNTTASVTITPSTNDPNAVVTVNGAAVVSGSASAAIALSVGTNIINTVVTAQDGISTDTYTITVTRAPSSIASLSNLVISSGTLNPVFTGATKAYTANVSNATTSVTLKPTLTDLAATLTVNGTGLASGTSSGAIALKVGPNVISTVVTAQDGTTTNTYTVTITRAPSSIATLSGLVVNSGISAPVFSPGMNDYITSVTNATTSVTVTPTVTDATATVKVNGITVLSGTPSAGIPLNVGPNTITTVVTAQDGITTDTYTITVNRAPSSDASLSAITISSGTLTPAFASVTTAYSAGVNNATNSITVTPAVTEANATIAVNGVPVESGKASGAIALAVGPNIITTIVTAQDGTTKKTYTITVTRAPSAIATLKNLILSRGTLTPLFKTNTNSYTASVSNATTSVSITPALSDATATVTVNGGAVASGTASGAIALNVGPNTVTTVVTAQDGTTTDTYTVTINRAPSSIATLSNITISSGTLSPVFAGAIRAYTANVSNATTSIVLTPTVTEPNATIQVNGVSVTSGTASGAIALNVGANIVTTIVTAQDGTTKDTYRVTITRAPSSIATLNNLAISSGSLTPAFATNTTSYTVSVANAITSVSLTPTVSDITATVKVNGALVASGAASANIPLNVGANTITTKITAQDGTTADTYTVIVSRAPSSDASLANLSMSPGAFTPVFAKGTTAYTASVSNATTSVTVTPTLDDATASITVNGTPVTSGKASGAIALNVGANVISTLITAQDGITTQTYTITVNRAPSAIATLNNLAVSQGTLTPAFATATTNYTVGVVNAVSSISLTPTVTDATATITVNGAAVTSGTASGGIALNVGANTITTVVTAQDGTTTDTYTVIVNRDKGAQLITFNPLITVNYGAPDFDPGATVNSGLPIVYTSSNPAVATIVNGLIHIVGIGPSVITASAAGNSQYYDATPVSATLIVNKEYQTINIIDIPALLKGATIDISGIASSSGLPVNIAIGDATIASVQGTILTAVSIGTTVLTLTQPGNADYYAASPINITITVTDAADDDFVVHQAVTPNGDGKNDFLFIEGIKNYPDNVVTLVNRNGVKIYQAKSYDNVSRVFDGHSNITGAYQQAGTYFYLIEYTARGIHKRKTGYFVLKY